MQRQELSFADWLEVYRRIAAENGLSLQFYDADKQSFELKMKLAEVWRKALKIEPLPFVNVIEIDGKLHCSNERGERGVFNSWKELDESNF